jgi:excinuclease ABC subunit C
MTEKADTTGPNDAVKTAKELLTDRVKQAPTTTGVYLMRDATGRLIYVGKAKNLRARVRSYFGRTDGRPMIPFLVPKIRDLQFIVTATEKEALILENNLIKKHRPRYNVTLRDDKNYFNIRIDLRDDFPRFQLVRQVKRDGARYFGPYSSSQAVKQTLHYLQQIFPLRTCKDSDFKSRQRPCIEYEIKRCTAPCCGEIGRDDYKKLVQESILFIEGRRVRLIADMEGRMTEAADRLDFEGAARLRDRIHAIETTLEKQTATAMSFKDQDVFGLYSDDHRVQVSMLHVRQGKIIGQRNLPPFTVRMELAEFLSSILKQYYSRDVSIPQEIIIPKAVEDRAVIEEWLEERRGKKVTIIVPRRGKSAELLTLAANNAKNVYETESSLRADTEQLLEVLSDQLKLRAIPMRIECFDISNIGGEYAAGSMVSFYGGAPDTSAYRRFRIRTLEGADDYGMMYEVLTRRYGTKENLPDLIVVDGGRGQLGVALAVLKELEIDSVDAVGLAKADPQFEGPGRPRIEKERDRVYLPGRKNPVYLASHREAMFLLQRVRDEAHRFAISYYRKVKEKSDFHSELDTIPGIGPARKKALLAHFQDVGKIRAATAEELTHTPGIGKDAAEKIYDYFHGRE